MRIGILTFHKAYNYGAFMQAFSLQSGLKKRFPNDDIEIIDFVPFHEVYRYWIKVPLWIMLHQGWKACLNQYRKYKAFSDAWKSFPLGKKAGNTTQSLTKRTKDYDYIIVGSDAVFNDTDLTGFTGISPFFLEKSETPRSSYAASAHGLNYEIFDETKKQRLKEALNRFQIIATRDYHTESFVLHMLGKQTDDRIMHTCDPTVFLDDFPESKYIKELIMDYKGKGKKVIAFMLKTERCGDCIREIERERDCVFVSLANYNHNADVQLVDATPFEWVTCLKYVDYVVTDYFHGTLVSLRMGKPVISIDISERKNDHKTKIEDLLIDRLNLPEFYFPYTVFKDESNHSEILQQCRRNIEFDYKEKILSSLNEEHKSFDVFCDALDRRIHL